MTNEETRWIRLKSRFGSKLLILMMLTSAFATAHAAVVRGVVLDAAGRAPLAGVSVSLQAARKGALTNEQGRFEVPDVTPGVYNMQAAILGYRRLVLYEVEVTPVRRVELEFVLEEEVVKTDSVSVTGARACPEFCVSPIPVTRAVVLRT